MIGRDNERPASGMSSSSHVKGAASGAGAGAGGGGARSPGAIATDGRYSSGEELFRAKGDRGKLDLNNGERIFDVVGSTVDLF